MVPLVTIRITTFNHEDFIGEALDRALAQTYPNLEILVLDDASTDGTRRVVERYRDPRIHYVRREENIGLVRNYNLGLPVAKGDLVWGVAGDDYLLDPTEVATRVEEFQRNPDLGFIFGRPNSNSSKHVSMFDWGAAAKSMTGHEVARACIDWNPICATTVMARGKLYRDLGTFPAPLLYAGDWYLWFRFALASKSVLYRPEPCVFYRYHEANMTNHFFSDKQADRLVQQIQLRLAMLELAEGIDGFKERIMAALGKSVRGLLDFWMNNPGSRTDVKRELARRWELDEVPRAGLNLPRILRDSLVEQTREMISSALRQRRPIYFLRALQLQAALPDVLRIACPRL